MRHFLLILPLACCSVTPTLKPTPTLVDADPPPTGAFEATLTIDAEPSAKQLQAVWLRDHAGPDYVVDYRARGFWKPFEGKRVQVTGQTWTPQGQALGADHYRVDTLHIVDKEQQFDLVRLGPEIELTGSFVHRQGEPGTKSAGSGWTEFRTASTTYLLANHSDKHVGDVTISARETEQSPFVTHRGGPMIWVLDVR